MFLYLWPGPPHFFNPSDAPADHHVKYLMYDELGTIKQTMKLRRSLLRETPPKEECSKKI